MKKPEKKKVLPEDSLLSGVRDCCACSYNQAYDDLEKYWDYLLSKIPSDEQINKSPSPNYARPYYQGQFDILMGLKYSQKR